jgi:hypothetical protein
MKRNKPIGFKINYERIAAVAEVEASFQTLLPGEQELVCRLITGKELKHKLGPDGKIRGWATVALNILPTLSDEEFKEYNQWMIDILQPASEATKNRN